jgi:hypothetical protein
LGDWARAFHEQSSAVSYELSAVGVGSGSFLRLFGEWSGSGAGVQHAVEGGAADAEKFCCAEFVAAAASEDLENVLLDDVVEALDLDRGCRGGGVVSGLCEGEKMAGFDEDVIGECGSLSEDAIKLTEIVGPEAPLELRECRLREHFRGLAGAVGETAQEPGREQGNVFKTLTQGRDKDFNDGKPGVEVLAELADGGEGAEIAVGGCEDSGVGAGGSRAAGLGAASASLVA